MTNEYKLSLPAAILININIMLGAGIFINTLNLAKFSASFGVFNLCDYWNCNVTFSSYNCKIT